MEQAGISQHDQAERSSSPEAEEPTAADQPEQAEPANHQQLEPQATADIIREVKSLIGGFSGLIGLKSEEEKRDLIAEFLGIVRKGLLR